MRKAIIVLAAILAPVFSYAAYTGGVLGGALIVPTWYAPDSTPYVTISSHTRVSDGGSNYVDIDPIVGFSGPGAGLTDLDWAELGNFPASCAPQCVVAIGTTLTCGACSGGGGSGGGNAYTTGGVIGQIPVYVAVDSITASGLIPSRVRTTTTAITGADVNTDILLSTNTDVARRSTDNVYSNRNARQYAVRFVGLEYLAGEYSGLSLYGDSNNSSHIQIYPHDDPTYPNKIEFVYDDFDLPYDIGGLYSIYRSTHVFGGTISATTDLYRYNFLGGDMRLQGQLTATAGINPASVDLSTTASKSSDNNFSTIQTFQDGIVTPSIEISSAVFIKDKGNAIASSHWGYSNYYPVVVVGNRNGPTGGSGTVAIGYDPKGNPSDTFSGDGKEVLFPNGVRFATPYDNNNGFYLATLTMKNQKIGLAGVTSPTVTFERPCPSGFTNVKAGDNQLGCMQTARSAGTATYWAANDYCFDNYGGRLPSLSEFYIAAANYTLTNPTGQWQWVSDYVGSSGCGRTGATAVTTPNYDGCGNSNYYRCWVPK